MHARSLFKGLAQSKLHVDEEDPSLNATFLHGNLELNSVRSWGIEFPIFLLVAGLLNHRNPHAPWYNASLYKSPLMSCRGAPG